MPPPARLVHHRASTAAVIQRRLVGAAVAVAVPLLSSGIGWLVWSLIDLLQRVAILEFWARWHGMIPRGQ